MQHDTLQEKGVILDEVAGLTSQMREQAAAARPVGASLAAAANAYQERLRKVTRGLMATISELSLYQVGGCALLSRQVAAAAPLLCAAVNCVSCRSDMLYIGRCTACGRASL
jgi:hypothetical protein